MADDELMPCLRCGEARNALGALVIMICHRYKEPVYRVHCSKCGSDSPERLSREEAVDAHNARVPDPALAAKDQRIARLEAKNADWREAHHLYIRCWTRAERLWKERHPDAEMYPDGAELWVWVKEQVDALTARTCETCKHYTSWWPNSPRGSCFGFAKGLECNRIARGFCDKWQAKEAADG